MKRQRIFRLMIIVTFCVFVCGFPSVWADTDGDFNYTINPDGLSCTVTGYTGGDVVVDIPSTIGGFAVTSIGDNAFRDFRSLTSINIPDSVTSIGNNAFYFCVDLTSINIPDSVTSIGNSAFAYCGLTNITIPAGMTSIGFDVFGCSSLKSITIPPSVTSIENNAFEQCNSLTSITIPDSVTKIGDLAFFNCTSLSNITIPTSVTSIGTSTFWGCTGLAMVYFQGRAPKTFGNAVFFSCAANLKIYCKASLGSTGFTDWTYPTVAIDDIAPVVSNVSSTLLKAGTVLSVTSSEPGTVYLVPKGTYSGKTDLDEASTKKSQTEGTVTIDTTALPEGTYQIYALDNADNSYNTQREALGLSPAPNISLPSADITIDNTAPINQNNVFQSSITTKGGTALTIDSVGETGDSVWFAPAGKTQATEFSAGATMTMTGGTDTSINAPANDGTYYLYVIDAAGNVSAASTAFLTVDNTAPVLSNVTPTVLKAGTTISTTCSEKGTLYLVLKGTYADKAALDEVSTAKRVDVSTAGTAVSIGTTDLADGTYQIYMVDAVGNISASSADITISDVPVIVFTRPLDGTKLNITTGSTVIAKLYDIGTDIDTASVTVQIDNGTAVKPTALVKTGDVYTLYYVITNINYGTANYSHSITVTAKYGVDKVPVSRSVTFTMEPKRNGFGFGKLRFD